MKMLHLSDLHFGHHDPELAAGFADDINAHGADLVVASGDFTQVGSKAEFEQAREFLDRLHAPVFAVPGNHDVPAVNIFRRFFDPYGLYRQFISPDLEPCLEMDGVVLVGMRTSRRARLEWNWGHGTISRSQLEELDERFAEDQAGEARRRGPRHVCQPGGAAGPVGPLPPFLCPQARGPFRIPRGTAHRPQQGRRGTDPGRAGLFGDFHETTGRAERL